MREILILVFASIAPISSAQVPFEQLDPLARIEPKDILGLVDFPFQTCDLPKQVPLKTVDQRFSHPRLAAAMRRYCQFVPVFFFIQEPGDTWSMDDTMGLHGNIALLGKSADLNRREFEGPLKPGGDPMSIRDYELIFPRKLRR